MFLCIYISQEILVRYFFGNSQYFKASKIVFLRHTIYGTILQILGIKHYLSDFRNSIFRDTIQRTNIVLIEPPKHIFYGTHYIYLKIITLGTSQLGLGPTIYKS